MYVAKHNKKFTLSEVEKLTREAIDTVTPSLWAKFCAHTEKVEEMYSKKNGLIEDVCEEIMLNIGEDDDDEDEVQVDEESDDQTSCQKQEFEKGGNVEQEHAVRALYIHTRISEICSTTSVKYKAILQ